MSKIEKYDKHDDHALKYQPRNAIGIPHCNNILSIIKLVFRLPSTVSDLPAAYNTDVIATYNVSVSAPYTSHWPSQTRALPKSTIPNPRDFCY